MTATPTTSPRAGREASIVADPDVPVVTITREFDAPPELVFRAHAEPEIFRQWVGPDRTEMVIDHYDCRRGGSFRYGGHLGADEFWFFGSFHDVRPGEKIVQTWTWEGMPDAVSLETMTFEALDGGRCRMVSTAVVDSMQAQAQMMASGMEVGINEGYAKLDRLFAAGAV